MTKLKLNDKWFRFVGVPVITLIGHSIFFSKIYLGDNSFGFWTIYLIVAIESIILWEANRQVILYFRNKYPSLTLTFKRIFSIILFCTPLTIIIRAANIWAHTKTSLLGYQFPLQEYLQNIFIALLFVILIGGVYEAIYYFTEWKKTTLERETLKIENLQTQLTSLKIQLSPHFLFNSLGSLSSLIDENPKKAQIFLSQMSFVYRYLLQANEKIITTLKEEMEFISAYSDMLKTRFGLGLNLSTELKEEYYEYYLPPLTVQVLLENAVKHNIAMPTKPLEVKIYCDDLQNLIIINNLQKKVSSIASNKTGLNSISSKYKLLNQPDISIEETVTHFKVTIPLIKNKDYAGINS